MKYKDWIIEWLELYIMPLKRRTYIRYKDICNLHIIPHLGDYELNELSSPILQRTVNNIKTYGNHKTGGELSTNYVNVIITIIQSSLKKANEIGYSSVYRGSSIQRPKIEEKQPRCFTVQEQKELEYAILEESKRKMLGVIIALYTGVRIGELLALRFSEVDMQKRTLTIRYTSYEDKDENGRYTKITDTTKSNRIRTIPFPKQLLPIFQELKALSKSGYVIENSKSEQMSIRSYQRSFELLVNKLGVSKLSFHALRHTFATRALESGMDIKTLSEILGHKSAMITLNLYAHSMMEHKQNAMDKLGTLFEK